MISRINSLLRLQGNTLILIKKDTITQGLSFIKYTRIYQWKAHSQMYEGKKTLMRGECGTWERNGQQQRQETGEAVEAGEK